MGAVRRSRAYRQLGEVHTYMFVCMYVCSIYICMYVCMWCSWAYGQRHTIYMYIFFIYVCMRCSWAYWQRSEIVIYIYEYISGAYHEELAMFVGLLARWTQIYIDVRDVLYICMYVCVYMCMHVHIFVCIYLHVCIYISLYECSYFFVGILAARRGSHIHLCIFIMRALWECEMFVGRLAVRRSRHSHQSARY